MARRLIRASGVCAGANGGTSEFHLDWVLSVSSRWPRQARWIALVAVACGGCASQSTAAHGPRAVPSGAVPDPSVRPSDDRLAALEALRAKLDHLLVDVEKRLLAERDPAPATAPEEPAPVAAVQRALDPTIESDDRGHGDPDPQIHELLERRLIVTVALARVTRALLRRRIELGLDDADGSVSPSARPLLSGGFVPADARGGDLDLANASLAAALQDAELALDEARRWKTRDATVVRAPASELGQGLLDDLEGGDVGPGDRRFRYRAGARGGKPLEDRFGADRGPGKQEAKTGVRRLEERHGAEPATGEGSADDLPTAHPKVAAPKRKAAPPGAAKGGGWFGADDKPDADATRRASVVVQGPPPAGVMPAVQRRLGGMLECIPAVTRLEGPVRFRVTARLGGDGQLHEALIRSASPLPPTVDACLVDELSRVRAPTPPDGASRMVSFPVWLSGE